MSFRVTDDQVREILEVDTAITDLSPFIQTAHQMVEDVLVPRRMLSDITLMLVEKWLSAHFVRMRDLQVVSESAGVSESRAYPVSTNLKASPYGQQAMMLDWTGTLSRMDRGEPGRVGPVFEVMP